MTPATLKLDVANRVWGGSRKGCVQHGRVGRLRQLLQTVMWRFDCDTGIRSGLDVKQRMLFDATSSQLHICG